MADLRLNIQSDDPQLLNPTSPADQDPGDQSPDEVMPPPWRADLPDCQPKIMFELYQNAQAEDREILDDIRRTSEKLSTQLQRSTVFPFRVQKLYEQAKLTVEQNGLEDHWIFFLVAPILTLAQELSGLEHAVRVLPLTTTTISPSSLLPEWQGRKVPRKIDFGIAIKLNDDTSHQIRNLPSLGNRDRNENGMGGIGPASTVPMLRTHPLFCHIEVKQQYQVVDLIVQLGVWTSAVYARWEQVRDLHGWSRRNLPISFGWTVEGRYWLLHLIRRLPNGSRRITESVRPYDTQNPADIYLIITTLYWLISYGHKDFREQFLASVLDISAW